MNNIAFIIAILVVILCVVSKLFIFTNNRKLKKYFKYYITKMNNETLKNNFSTWEDVYEEIYEYYLKKFKENNNKKEIIMEKMDLKYRSKVKYEEIDLAGHGNILIAIIAVFITNWQMISDIEKVKELHNLINSMIFISIAYECYVFLIKPLINKNSMDDFYSICHDIVEQVEKELDEDKEIGLEIKLKSYKNNYKMLTTFSVISTIYLIKKYINNNKRL